jgi:hypothetical protein
MRKILGLMIIMMLLPCGIKAIEIQEEMMSPRAVRDEIAYQVDVVGKVLEHFNALFVDFSEGYLEPDGAMEKLSVWKNEYYKAMDFVVPQGVMLHDLMKQLFSRTENYFIYYNRSNRENPILNSKIANVKFEIMKEITRLSYVVR